MTYAKYKVKDDAYGQLNASISSGATSVTLQSGHGANFPTYSSESSIGTLVHFDTDGVTVLSKERVTITARTSDTLTITRGYGGDTPTAFAQDDYLFIYSTEAVITDIQDEVTRLETDKLDISDYQNGTKVYAASSVGTDSYAVTLSPAPSSYVTGMCFRFLADVANTGAATLNVNALGAKTIKKLHDQDLDSGDIEAGQIVTVTYDGTNFQMDSQVATIPTVDISGLTEDTTGDMDNDFLLEYDDSAGANRKIKPITWRATATEAKSGTVTNKIVTPYDVVNYVCKALFSPIAGTATTIGSVSSTALGSDGSYTKKIEIAVPYAGTYTVAHTNTYGSGYSSGSVYSRIYVDGSAVGTERVDAGSWSEDITITDGQAIQIYCKVTGSPGSWTITSFSIKCSLVPKAMGFAGVQNLP